MKKRLWVVLMVMNLMYSAVCLGQDNWIPGYVVKPSGDTIKGLIRDENDQSQWKQCKFKVDANGLEQNFKPADLLAYKYNDGRYYVTKMMPDSSVAEPVFFEFMVHGKVNLYRLNKGSERYFVEKDSAVHELKNTETIERINNQNYEKKNREYVGTLFYLFGDANMQSDISESVFRPKALIGLAKKYHDKVCTDEVCVIYEREVKPIHVNFSLHGGPTYNKLNFGTVIETDYRLGAMLGCRFEFENIIDLNENISVMADVNLQWMKSYTLSPLERYFRNVTYEGKTYTISTINSASTFVTSLDVNTNALFLKIPISVNYTFLKGNFRPYVGVGFINELTLSQNDEFKLELFYDRYGQSIPFYNFGFQGKIGGKIKLNSEHVMYLECNFERSETLKVDQLFHLRNVLFSFVCGYTF